MRRRTDLGSHSSTVGGPGAATAKAIAEASIRGRAPVDGSPETRRHRLVRRGGVAASARVPLVAETGLTADANGAIVQCDPALAMALGYRAEELVGMLVGQLLPELADVSPLADGLPDPRLSFLCHCDFRFRAIGTGGRALTSRLAMSRVGELGNLQLRIIVRDACGETTESRPR